MSIQLYTNVCRELGIEYPLFSAGLAGGPGTAELTAAISAAGGFGTLGAAYLEPIHLREDIRLIRKKTDRPFCVNLFVPSFAPENIELNDDDIRKALSIINLVRAQFGLEELQRLPEAKPDAFHEQLQILFDEEVAAIGTTFGVLPDKYRKEVKARKIKVITMVTSVEEAVQAEAEGSDVLVVQGAEAGGHRGTFDIQKHPQGANVGTFALVPQVADKVSVPIIAAGGIMDGRGLVAALALGAQGVQLGTRFLTSREAGTHPIYQQALLNSVETDTAITKAFSGRPARGVKNTFMDMWCESNVGALPFPIQNTLTREIRAAAAASGNSQYLSLWAGQGLRMLTTGESAADILHKIVSQAQVILGD